MLKNLFLITCLLLSGCMVGPDYKEPAKPVTQHWKKNNSSVSEKSFRNPEWWHVFHDPTLTQLVNEGYSGNLTLQSAGVKVLLARAQLAQSVGNLYPQQQVIAGSYNYNRIGGTYLEALLPPSFDTASLGFSVNWELDFWGKYRRAIQSKNAVFLASFAAYDNALVTLIADIGGTYIHLRTDQAKIKTTKANIEVQEIALKIARS